jgi:hypothetical protein
MKEADKIYQARVVRKNNNEDKKQKKLQDE